MRFAKSCVLNCNPGNALAREIREVIVPDFDTYCFRTMAKVAQDNGSYNSTAITTSNAFEILMKGVEYFGNHNVPMENVYCFAAYKYTGMLMRDNSFVRYSDSSQEMLKKGIIDKAAGIEIVQMPDASSGKSMISAGIVPSDEQLSAMGWTPQQYWVYKMSQASAAQ